MATTSNAVSRKLSLRTHSANGRFCVLLSLPGFILLCASSAVCFAQTSTGAATAAPSAAQLQTVDASPFNAASLSNVIEPGDTVQITVFNTPELSGSLRVDPDGKVPLPVGGDLPVSGLTLKEASIAIQNRLKVGQIMLDPHVNVIITQLGTQGVTMFGEVRSPGIFPVRGSTTLYDALAQAGGPTATEGGTISIARRGDPDHPQVILVTSSNYSSTLQTTRIYPGDTILVSKAESVYIVGDMKQTGAYPMPYGKRFTILNLLALTGGPNVTAATSKASIVRGTPSGGVETIPLDLNKILKNQAPNVLLEASDVLVVPHSGLKNLEQIAIPSALGTLIGIGVSQAFYR